MLRLGAAFVLVVVFAPLASACEEGASDPERAYLASFCEALEGFSDQVALSSSAGALRAAFEAFVSDLDALQPPESLANFHARFGAYVREAAGHPGTTSISEVPRPPSDVRSRLSSIEHDVPGCRAPTPFRVEN